MTMAMAIIANDIVSALYIVVFGLAGMGIYVSRGGDVYLTHWQPGVAVPSAQYPVPDP